MPITQPSDIRLNRQNDLEAIIGHPPGWTLSWGMLVLFLSVFLLLTISWFVSYPDSVDTKCLLTTENPPIRLMAGASAKIVSLNADNEELVSEGEILGVLENPANTDDVLELDLFIELLSASDPSTYPNLSPPNDLQLGNLQQSYAGFVRNYDKFLYFLSQDINYLKIINLRNQISQIEKLNASIFRQIKIMQEEVEVSYIGVERDSELLVEGVYSPEKFETTLSEHLIMKRSLENLKSVPLSNLLEIKQLEAQILVHQHTQSDSQNNHILEIKKNVQQIQGEIDNWKQKWLLMAPMDGEIALTKARNINQFVEEGTEVMTIIPTDNAGKVIAKAHLVGFNSGKVKEGMNVQIRLDGFSYKEYGVVNGRIKRIANVRGEDELEKANFQISDGYEIEIELTDNLITSYNDTIPFRQEMKGNARIITENRSLLMRILEDLKTAFED